MLTAEEFGKTSGGESVALLRLTNARGTTAELLSYGCVLRALSLRLPSGAAQNLCAGYGTLEEYERGRSYMGAVIGRTAGRIAGARFSLGGREYRLCANDGENQLHGGGRGFDRRVWSWRARGDGVVFSRRSPDGEEGYPGNLDAEVSYDLSDRDELTIGYRAVTDAETLCSLTSHAYWNLGAPIDRCLLRVFSDRYAEARADLLPTGRVLSVKGTPFDFRGWAPLGGAVIDHSFPWRGRACGRPALSGTRRAEWACGSAPRCPPSISIPATGCPRPGPPRPSRPSSCRTACTAPCSRPPSSGPARCGSTAPSSASSRAETPGKQKDAALRQNAGGPRFPFACTAGQARLRRVPPPWSCAPMNSSRIRMAKASAAAPYFM